MLVVYKNALNRRNMSKILSVACIWHSPWREEYQPTQQDFCRFVDAWFRCASTSPCIQAEANSRKFHRFRLITTEMCT